MRIRIPTRNPDNGGVFEPIDPPPVIDIDQFFTLDLLEASKTVFSPFEPVTITWAFSPKNDSVDPRNFAFSLFTHEGILADNLESSGSLTINPIGNVLVRVQGRRLGGSKPTTLGSGLALSVDESGCETIEIAQIIFDTILFSRFEQITGQIAEVRLRRETRRVGAPGSNEFEVVVLQPESTWTTREITIKFPLEIVINNFFNADFDLEMVLKFDVGHDDRDSTLEAAIDFDLKVDFSTLEDILSLGNSSAVARTLNAVLPLVFECERPHIEAAVLQGILGLPGVQQALRNNRLLAARILVGENAFTTVLQLVFCPVPDLISRPSAPDTGGVIV